MQVYRHIFEADLPRRPSKTLDDVAHLKKMVKDHVDKCQYLGEFPSIKMDKSAIIETQQTHKDYPPPRQAARDEACVLTENIMKATENIKNVLKKTYQIKRTKASQVVVLLLSNMDRNFNPETGHSVAIGYFLRGYSLLSDTMQRIREQFRQACH